MGYPPVLEALSLAYDDENNTIKLLNKLINEGVNESTKLIYDIMEELIKREQCKVINALKESWITKYPEFDEWDAMYSPYEQLICVMEFVDLGSHDLYINTFVSKDMMRDYMDIINSFLPQHPFIRHTINNQLDFAGPAFRDYVLAKLFNDDNYGDLVNDYNSGSEENTNVPSQLFFDFFLKEPDCKIHGKDFPFIYDAFKAKERMQYKGVCRVSGDDENIVVSFNMWDGEKEILDKSIEMFNEPITVNKLIEASIMTDGSVVLGDGSSCVEISDSHIDCRKLVINSKELYIKSTIKGGVFINSGEEVTLLNSNLPRIIVETESDENVRIDIPNSKSFYQFDRYKYKKMALDEERLLRFAAIVEKLLDCMRKHHKDVPAKECDYIDNEIIAQNIFKKEVFDNLQRLKIIFIDNREKHLYKLDVEKLKEYDIGWQSLNLFGSEKFIKLYKCCEWSEVSTNATSTGYQSVE